MSSSTMRPALQRVSAGPLLVAWMLLAAAAAYPQTLKTTVLADGSTVGLPPYWWVAAQSPGSMDLKGPRGEGISLGAALPVYSSPPGPAIGAYRPMVAPCCDPVRATYALAPQIARGLRAARMPAPELCRVVASQPVSAPSGQAAYLLMELDLNGHKIRACCRHPVVPPLKGARVSFFRPPRASALG